VISVGAQLQPFILDWGSADRKSEVTGHRATTRRVVPFDGGPALFRLQPRRLSTMKPDGTCDVLEEVNVVSRTWEHDASAVSGLKQADDEWMNDLKVWVGFVNTEIEEHNDSLGVAALRLLAARNLEIEAARTLNGL
jgi:hypothetical protein